MAVRLRIRRHLTFVVSGPGFAVFQDAAARPADDLRRVVQVEIHELDVRLVLRRASREVDAHAVRHHQRRRSLSVGIGLEHATERAPTHVHSNTLRTCSTLGHHFTSRSITRLCALWHPRSMNDWPWAFSKRWLN